LERDPGERGKRYGLGSEPMVGDTDEENEWGGPGDSGPESRHPI